MYLFIEFFFCLHFFMRLVFFIRLISVSIRYNGKPTGSFCLIRILIIKASQIKLNNTPNNCVLINAVCFNKKLA